MNFSKDNEAVRNIAKLATGSEGSDKNDGKKTLSRPSRDECRGIFHAGPFFTIFKSVPCRI